MSKVTISVPDELKREMDRRKAINWSEVARKAFKERVRREEMMEAAEQIRKMRADSHSPQWNGVKAIRRSRDASRFS